MALKIFGTDPETQPKPRQSFADDVVGRFRSGHQLNGRPASLNEWRITTGDPDVASAIYEELGGDAPQEWEAKGEDNLEVFSASDEVEIIIERPNSLRERMILWGRNGKIIAETDGETMADGTPDPDAELTFQERKQKARDGIGPEPSIELYFRLASHRDLGIFKFVTGSWSMARDLAAETVADRLAEIDGPAVATLKIEQVEFTAKSGAMAGKLVQYNKPVLTIKGAANDE